MKRLSVGLIAAFLLFSGCAHSLPMPGDITITKSEFDGTTKVSMEPALVCIPEESSCLIKLSLMHDSTMANDQAIMKVIVRGVEPFSNTDEAVKFNIDGEILGLPSIDAHSSLDLEASGSGSAYQWTSQRYMVDKRFIEKLLRGKRVVIRVDLQRSHVEGIFSENKSYRARPAFKKFYKKVFSTQS